MRSHGIFLLTLGLALWIPVSAARCGVIVTTLYSFSGTNGIGPEGQLLKGPDGAFYGTAGDTAATGGNYGSVAYGRGTIFRINTNGVFTTLHRFDGTNGAFPRSGLVIGRNGNFYGTTAGGGSNGLGTVFSVTSSGVLTPLAFLRNGDGAVPCGGLVALVDGTLFGTATFGGIRAKGAPPDRGPGTDFFNFGTVFKVTADHVLTPIFRFGSTNGANPYSKLVQGQDGNFYGTTAKGGANDSGTAFRISANGRFKPLFDFGGTNGIVPNELVLGKDGNFYGTTRAGGLMYQGTVFKITPAGKLTTLACFNKTDGGVPTSPLVAGVDGRFYGTTASGGAGNEGTIFGITSDGVLTIEYSFTNGCIFPPNLATLTRGDDGNLYGTTTCEGQYRCGSIFRVTLNSKIPGGKQVVQPRGPRPTNEIASVGTVTNLEVWFRPTIPPTYQNSARLVLYRFRTTRGDFFVQSSIGIDETTPEAHAKAMEDVIAHAMKLQIEAGTTPLLVFQTYEEDFPDGSVELLQGNAIFYPDERHRVPSDSHEFSWDKYPAICQGYGFLTNFDMIPDDRLIASIPLNWKGQRMMTLRMLSGSGGGP
jgi:uncharacterized repeat protein (TIGR03803 family)